jgi:hypothetical protein
MEHCEHRTQDPDNYFDQIDEIEVCHAACSETKAVDSQTQLGGCQPEI